MSVLSGLGLVFVAFGVGAYGAVTGVAGGFLLGPLLILVWKVPPAQAVGTTLTVVFLNSATGAIGYAGRRWVDYRSGLVLALAALPGSVLGAWGVKAVSGETFMLALGALLVGVALYILFSSSRREPHLTPLPPLPGSSPRSLVTKEGTAYTYRVWEVGLAGVGTLFGFLSSFFGLGGGFLRTPLLIYAFRFPVKVAAATSLFAMALYTMIGVAAHGSQGNISLPLALLGGVGVMAGSQVGVWAAPFVRAIWVLRALGLALVAIGAQLMVTGLLKGV